MHQAASQERASVPPPVCSSKSSSEPVSSTVFRGAMSNFTTSVSVIATGGEAGMAGLTCSAVCAVSDTPATLAVCIHGKSTANSVIKANGVLSVNCLQVDQVAISQAFAGIGGIAMADRFAMADWGVLVTGAPCCKDALSTLDCEIVAVHEVGTHSIFIAQVIATQESQDCDPLIYQRRSYATTRSF